MIVLSDLKIVISYIDRWLILFRVLIIVILIYKKWEGVFVNPHISIGPRLVLSMIIFFYDFYHKYFFFKIFESMLQLRVYNTRQDYEKRNVFNQEHDGKLVGSS